MGTHKSPGAAETPKSKHNEGNAAVAPAQPSLKRSEGMLERYNWFINNSNMGDDCTYARKCEDLFLRDDYEEIRDLFLECLEEFRKIEGLTFGRDK